MTGALVILGALLPVPLLVSCSTARHPGADAVPHASPVGFSGMALIEPNRYLVVHDAKVYEVHAPPTSGASRDNAFS